MELFWLILSSLWVLGRSTEIKLVECRPPNLPVLGGYAPLKARYLPGDIVHYFCDIDAHIAGGIIRVCQDTGEWSGQTPMCDTPMTFKFTNQSSDKDDRSTSDIAVDGQRATCSETSGGEKGEWVGIFNAAGALFRIMIFLPTGNVSYDIILVKTTGQEILCISHKSIREHHGWVSHTCYLLSATDVIGIKIRSQLFEPLKICEIAAYVLTSPICEEPYIHIKNGHLILNRQTAVLKCDKGFYESKDFALECIKDGHWENKDLHCYQPEWEVNDKEPQTKLRGVHFDPLRRIPGEMKG